MWAEAGLVLAAAVAALSTAMANRPPNNYYAGEIYGMMPAVHRRYALVSLLFAGLFAAAMRARGIPQTAVFAGYTLIVLFYATSFLRGFSDEQ
jgi:hypothetical protein